MRKLAVPIHESAFQSMTLHGMCNSLGSYREMWDVQKFLGATLCVCVFPFVHFWHIYDTQWNCGISFYPSSLSTMACKLMVKASTFPTWQIRGEMMSLASKKTYFPTFFQVPCLLFLKTTFSATFFLVST